MSAILKEDPPDLSVTNQNVSPGARAHRAALPREEPGAALPVGARPGVRPGGAFRHLRAVARSRWATRPPAALARARRAGGDRRGFRGRPSPLEAGGAVPAHLPAHHVSPREHRHCAVRAGRQDGGLRRLLGRTAASSSTRRGRAARSRRRSATRTRAFIAVSSTGELACPCARASSPGATASARSRARRWAAGAPRAILEFVEWADWSPDGKDIAIIRFARGDEPARVSARQGPLSNPPRRSSGLRVLAAGRPHRLPGAGRHAPCHGPRRKDHADRGGPARDQRWSGRPPETRSGSTTAAATARAGCAPSISPGSRASSLAHPDGSSRTTWAPTAACLVEAAVSPAAASSGWRRASRRSATCPGTTGRGWPDCPPTAGRSRSTKAGDATRDGEFYLRTLTARPPSSSATATPRTSLPTANGCWCAAQQREEIVLVPTGTGNAVALPAGGFERVDDVLLHRRRQIRSDRRGRTGREASVLPPGDPDGKPRQLFEGAGYAGKALSPDGRWIVAYGPTGHEDLIVTPLDGGAATTIPHTNTLDPGPLDRRREVPPRRRDRQPSRARRPHRRETGRRELWKELGPPDLSGVIEIAPMLITADEKSYVYGYSSSDDVGPVRRRRT